MKPKAVVLTAAFMLAAAVSPVSAVPPREAPDYDSIRRHDAGLWPTGDAVRRAMQAMRTAVEAEAARPVPDAERLAALAAVVATRAGALLACCVSVDFAGRHLEMLLREMLDGADLMQGAQRVEARRMGLSKVVQAMNIYGDLFDHPGWQAVDDRAAASAAAI